MNKHDVNSIYKAYATLRESMEDLDDDVLLPKKTRYKVDAQGNKRSFDENNQLHSFDDLPAFVGANGSRTWMQHGIVHREGDEPAIIFRNGSKIWYKNGEIHRSHGKPAVVNANGSKSWWENGVKIKEES